MDSLKKSCIDECLFRKLYLQQNIFARDDKMTGVCLCASVGVATCFGVEILIVDDHTGSHAGIVHLVAVLVLSTLYISVELIHYPAGVNS